MPASIHDKLLNAMHRFKLCHRDDRLIVAVSGGADSVALLHLLCSLPEFSLKLVVAHLNHLLRGEESDADERFVRELANGYGLPCEVRRSDVEQHAKQWRLSLEEAGRKARYDFFEELKMQYEAVAVAVAHHADDQAETFLLRLLRGAGTTGLSAMAPVNQGGIIRPLLEISRQELRDYLTEKQLTFREDTSNTDRSFLRNRIRHELLPLLADYSPGISGRLAGTARMIGEDEALLAESTSEHFSRIATLGEGWCALSRTALVREPEAQRLRLYRSATAAVLGDLKRFERLHFLLLDSCLRKETTGTQLDLPRRLVAVLTAEHLLLAHKEQLQISPPITCIVNGPGRYDLGNGLVLIFDHAPVPDSWRNIASTITYIDPEQDPFPWQIRPIVPGERMELLGMAGSRAVQDILTDLKIPHYLRCSLPVITSGGRTVWLAGIRRTRHALVQSNSKSVLCITLSGTEKLPLFP
jgi:tRNA(Ile)-lysidine synthase